MEAEEHEDVHLAALESLVKQFASLRDANVLEEHVLPGSASAELARFFGDWVRSSCLFFSLASALQFVLVRWSLTFRVSGTRSRCPQLQRFDEMLQAEKGSWLRRA